MLFSKGRQTGFLSLYCTKCGYYHNAVHRQAKIDFGDIEAMSF